MFKISHRPHVMGILNITSDSFSGDGLLKHPDEVIKNSLKQTERFLKEGATIIDVGGESTRPEALFVDEKQELERVIPVIKALRAHFTTLFLSIDTMKANVAKQALQEGADMINDVTGFQYDPAMLKVAVASNAYAVITHSYKDFRNKDALSSIRKRSTEDFLFDVVKDVKKTLQERVSLAIQSGAAQNKLILDPGIGFGKTPAENLDLIRRLDEIVAIGYPVLLGVSRKSFIGHMLNAPTDDRLGASLACNIIGYLKGASILRVHDVKETKQAMDIISAMGI